MEKGKKIDASCIGFAEEAIPCERELQDLGEWSACTVVAQDLEVDGDGDLVGTMILSFGPDYSDKRKIEPKLAYRMAEIVNDVIDRRQFDEERGDEISEDEDDGCECCCAGCEGAKMDITDDDVVRLGEELKEAVEDFGKLISAIAKKK